MFHLHQAELWGVHKMSWDKKGGRGLWTEYVNDKTGESSIKEHDVKPIKKWCAKDKHDYRITNMGKREAECSKCGQTINFTVGKDTIKGDKVLLG